MSIQGLMDSVREMARKDRSQYHITLGEMSSILENHDGQVTFKCGDSITSVANPHSYRGYYSDLSLETVEPHYMAGEDLLNMLKGVYDTELTGWKGGDYRMKFDTPIWVSAEGFASRWAVVHSHLDELNDILVFHCKEID